MPPASSCFLLPATPSLGVQTYRHILYPLPTTVVVNNSIPRYLCRNRLYPSTYRSHIVKTDQTFDFKIRYPAYWILQQKFIDKCQRDSIHPQTKARRGGDRRVIRRLQRKVRLRGDEGVVIDHQAEMVVVDILATQKMNRWSYLAEVEEVEEDGCFRTRRCKML